jgi:hypothetical protein
MSDWLDRNTPKGALLHLGTFFYCLIAFYLLFRFGTQLPVWLTNVFAVVLVAPAACVFVLVTRAGMKREAQKPTRKESLPRVVIQAVLMLAVLAGLTLPIWIVMYFLHLGAGLWK